MFRLSDSWVWDSWLVDDGRQYHLFFLYASRALHDPDARHYRASVGHAVSDDLRSWERIADALVRSDAPAFDDLATWTGSIVQHPDGRWFCFYTGTTQADAGNVQSIGYATSDDLVTWHKAPGPVVAASQWYERLSDGVWHDEAFRDPWVYPDPDGDGWHMLITARATAGHSHERGVVGHARSSDLENWTLLPPLTEPGQGFGQLEVLQTVEVDGNHFLVFNCLAPDIASERQGTTTGGIWAARAGSPTGPFDIAGARQLTDDQLYVGRTITDRSSGRPVMLAFRNNSAGGFVGDITDPMPLVVVGGDLVIDSSTPGVIPAEC